MEILKNSKFLDKLPGILSSHIILSWKMLWVPISWFQTGLQIYRTLHSIALV